MSDFKYYAVGMVILVGLGIGNAMVGDPLGKLLNPNDKPIGEGRRSRLVKRGYEASTGKELTSAGSGSQKSSPNYEARMPGNWQVGDSAEKLVLDSQGGFRRDLRLEGLQFTEGGLRYSHRTTCTLEGIWWMEGGTLMVQVKKVGNIQTRDMKVLPPQAGEKQVAVPDVAELRTLLPREISKLIQKVATTRDFGGKVTNMSGSRMTLENKLGPLEYRRLD